MIGAVEATARLWFAFVLGAFTFFAPCAYPLLPGYVAFFLGTAGADDGAVVARRDRLLRATGVGLLASAGFFLVYALLGGAVVVVGTAAFGDIVVLELAVGVLLIALGALMAAGRTPSATVPLPARRRSATGFLLFGVVYAAAAAGCTALPFVAVVSTSLSVDPLLGVGALVAYAGGMSAVMVSVTVLAGLGRERALRAVSRRVGRIERVAGGLLAVAGAAQVYLFLFRFGGLAMLGFG